MLITALFMIAKVWEQVKCPSTDDWIKKTWCRYIVGHHSAIKRNKALPFAATWMDSQGIMLIEMCQRERHILHDTTYNVESKTYNKLMNITTKKGYRLTDTENKLVVTSGERDGGGAIQRGKGLLHEILCVKLLKIVSSTFRKLKSWHPVPSPHGK